MKDDYVDYERSDISTTFMELRKKRGYTQTDIGDDVVSKSLISKFEKGNAMLSADKLFHVITKLNMTPNEFVNVLNNYQPDRMQQLYATLNQIRFSGPQGVAKSEQLIIEETEDRFEQLSNVMIKSVLQDVTGKNYVSDDEKLLVGDYLSGVDNWTEFEVKLLYYACPIFDAGDLFWFGELLIDRTKHFYSGGLKNLFLSTMMNLYEGVILYQELEYADFFRRKIKNIEFVGDLAATINFEILKYLHDYTRERTKENLIQAERYLDKVEVLGIKPVVAYYREQFRILNQK
jgi:Rgg/GadR/MutR family transcriptional activator